VAATERATPATLLSESVATAGLCLVIFVLSRSGRARLIAPALAAYVLGVRHAPAEPVWTARADGVSYLLHLREKDDPGDAVVDLSR
jgi:high-affinity nickel permease